MDLLYRWIVKLKNGEERGPVQARDKWEAMRLFLSEGAVTAIRLE